MFSTGFSTGLLIICALTVAFCVAIVVWISRIGRYVHAAVEHMHRENKRAVSLRRIAEHEATLTELSDAYDALLTSHKKLRSRIGMRENRAKRANGAESTDSPEAERLALKKQLRDRARKDGHRGL